MIHQSSVIDPKAQISKNVKIGPFCYVGPEVKLGENVELISNNESYLKSINDRSVMPNVTKLSLSDAIALLENLGLEVEVYGDGNKINQSLKSGTKISKNQKIILKLT